MPQGIRSINGSMRWESSVLDDLSNAIHEMIKHESLQVEVLDINRAAQIARSYQEALQRRKALVEHLQLAKMRNDVPPPSDQTLFVHHLKALKDKDILSHEFAARYPIQGPPSKDDPQARKMHITRYDSKNFYFDEHFKEFKAPIVFVAARNVMSDMIEECGWELRSWYTRAAVIECESILHRLLQEPKTIAPGPLRETFECEMPKLTSLIREAESSDSNLCMGTKILDHLPDALNQLYTRIADEAKAFRKNVNRIVFSAGATVETEGYMPALEKLIIDLFTSMEEQIAEDSKDDSGEENDDEPESQPQHRSCSRKPPQGATTRAIVASEGPDPLPFAPSEKSKKKALRKLWRMMDEDGPRPYYTNVTSYSEGRGLPNGQYRMIQVIAQK